MEPSAVLCRAVRAGSRSERCLGRWWARARARDRGRCPSLGGWSSAVGGRRRGQSVARRPCERRAPNASSRLSGCMLGADPRDRQWSPAPKPAVGWVSIEPTGRGDRRGEQASRLPPQSTHPQIPHQAGSPAPARPHSLPSPPTPSFKYVHTNRVRHLPCMSGQAVPARSGVTTTTHGPQPAGGLSGRVLREAHPPARQPIRPHSTSLFPSSSGNATHHAVVHSWWIAAVAPGPTSPVQPW